MWLWGVQEGLDSVNVKKGSAGVADLVAADLLRDFAGQLLMGAADLIEEEEEGDFPESLDLGCLLETFCVLLTSLVTRFFSKLSAISQQGCCFFLGKAA